MPFTTRCWPSDTSTTCTPPRCICRSGWWGGLRSGRCIFFGYQVARAGNAFALSGNLAGRGSQVLHPGDPAFLGDNSGFGGNGLAVLFRRCMASFHKDQTGPGRWIAFLFVCRHSYRSSDQGHWFRSSGALRRHDSGGDGTGVFRGRSFLRHPSAPGARAISSRSVCIPLPLPWLSSGRRQHYETDQCRLGIEGLDQPSRVCRLPPSPGPPMPAFPQETIPEQKAKELYQYLNAVMGASSAEP